MDTDKIIQDLNRRFAAPLPEFYQRRIIFLSATVPLVFCPRTRSLVRLRFPNLAFMSWITWDGVYCCLPCFWCCLIVSF